MTGVYIEPIFYTKITHSNNKILLTKKQKRTKVVSNSVAYIIKNLLTSPVQGTHGTATNCSISGFDVAAKTGTTDDNYDRWLCGFTNYYTCVTWYGFDLNENIDFPGDQNPAGLLWSSVMRSIHEDLPKSRFQKPTNVTSATICSSTGNIANDNCPNTYTEYYLRGTIPSKCNEHTSKNSTNTNTINKNNNTNKNNINNVTTNMKNNTIINNSTVDNNIINNSLNSVNNVENNTHTNTYQNTINNTSTTNSSIDNIVENTIKNTTIINNTTSEDIDELE